jgi:hypothetical protein
VYQKLGHEMDKDVLGEFERFTLFYEEKSFGGI